MSSPIDLFLQLFRRLDVFGTLESTDPLLALAGSGSHLWSDEHADDYVHRLRSGW